MRSVKPEERPRPRPDAKELLSSLMQSLSGVGESDGVGPDSQRPWRREDLEEVEPICAAFWSNAVAERAGWCAAA